MKFVYTPGKETVYQMPVEIQMEVWSLSYDGKKAF